MTITFTLPLHLKSPNVAENGWARSARRKTERTATWLGWLEHRRKLADGETATVTLTRGGQRRLDDDNLRGSCKTVVDTLSALLILGEMPKRGRMGHYDAYPQLTWRYEQAVGEYEVRVSIDVSSPAQDFEAMTEEMTWKGER